jgi:hypothetical protein
LKGKIMSDINQLISTLRPQGNGLVTVLGDDGKTPIWYRQKPRLYSVQVVRSAVASAQFPNNIIQIDQGTLPFMLVGLSADDTVDTTNILVQEPWFVQAQDNDDSFYWTSQITSRSAFFGGRDFGKVLPEPVPIRPLTRITFTLQNAVAPTGAGTATITLFGWQYFKL